MIREQRPTPPNEWLYKDYEEVREFAKIVCLPATETYWQECTDEEKEAWEAEHPQPEPTDPENE